MAARSSWKGSLKLSLVTIPVRAYPATNPGSDVSFHQLHRKCHTRIQLKKWCPHCHEEVGKDDIVKGYESSKGQYVIVEEEEIARLRPKSSGLVDVSHVVDAAAVDPIFIERAYYLAPDGKAAGPAFAVVRAGLDGRAAIGRVALHGREYLVAVTPRESALILYTLRTAGEVRDMDDVEELSSAAKARPEEVKLARQILDSFESTADLSTFVDNYEVALKQMLRTKGTKAVSEPEAPAKPARVVNLMDALRQSLERVSAGKKPPAVARPKATTSHAARPAGKHVERRSRRAS
ncbi:MAG: Ku protein [Acidobacteria bacterium]|nr:Ku protein [Acidobacteriota bacterium]